MFDLAFCLNLFVVCFTAFVRKGCFAKMNILCQKLIIVNVSEFVTS